MDLQTFRKNIEVVLTWRLKTGKKSHEWPDSRAPEFAELMLDGGVVGQDLEKALVALCAWREGRIDVYQGMSSIVHLLRNRQNAGMFRSHLSASDIFCSMTQEGNPELDSYPPEDPGQDFELLLKNLDDILQGKTVDISQGSIYYGEISEHTPEWFDTIIHSDQYERTTKIGNRVFYKVKKKG